MPTRLSGTSLSKGSTGEAPGRPGAPLGSTGNFIATPGQRGRRRDFWRLLRGIRTFTTLPSVRGCGSALAFSPDLRSAVEVKQGRGGAYFKGIKRCGSPWSCPVCSAQIRGRRGLELSMATVRHLEAGGGVMFLTVTLRHFASDRLVRTLEAMQAGFSACCNDGSVKRLLGRLGHVGKVRAVEITHTANGWHPHIHALIFTERPAFADELVEIERAIFRVLARHVGQSLGRTLIASRAVDLRPVTLHDASNRAEYVAGMDAMLAGYEVARGDTKEGRKNSRTIREICESAVGGDMVDRNLWHEYELATKGRQSLVWSPGLKARLGVAELSDEEASDPEREGDEVVCGLTMDDWECVCEGVNGHSRVLDAAEDGGADAVRRVLDELRSERYERWQRPPPTLVEAGAPLLHQEVELPW